MMFYNWLSNNWVEIFGAVTGIIYVFLEIRQHLWLWPVGVFTSAVYIWVFFMGKFYADMSLQVYYLVISFLGWYWWLRGTGERRPEKKLKVTRIKLKLALVLFLVFIGLYALIYAGLTRLTDSPVPQWDSFITSLSIVATWMLARKIYEHWFLWIVVNSASSMIFFVKGLYPTVILYLIYLILSFAGLRAWKRTLMVTA